MQSRVLRREFKNSSKNLEKPEKNSLPYNNVYNLKKLREFAVKHIYTHCSMHTYVNTAVISPTSGLESAYNPLFILFADYCIKRKL